MQEKREKGCPGCRCRRFGYPSANFANRTMPIDMHDSVRHRTEAFCRKGKKRIFGRLSENAWKMSSSAKGIYCIIMNFSNKKCNTSTLPRLYRGFTEALPRLFHSQLNRLLFNAFSYSYCPFFMNSVHNFVHSYIIICFFYVFFIHFSINLWWHYFC